MPPEVTAIATTPTFCKESDEGPVARSYRYDDYADLMAAERELDAIDIEAAVL